MNDANAVLTKATLRAAAVLNLSEPELAHIVGVEPAALHAANALKTAEPSGRLALLFLRLYRAIVGLLGGDEAEARAWFHAPNRHLGGIPAELVRTRDGLLRAVHYSERLYMNRGRTTGVGTTAARTTKRTSTVHLPAALVRAARLAAAASQRSVAEQVEFWARLGKVSDTVLPPSKVDKLLSAHGLPSARRRPRSASARAPRSKGKRSPRRSK